MLMVFAYDKLKYKKKPILSNDMVPDQDKTWSCIKFAI